MKKDILLFRISCVLFAISSFSILLSFIGDYKGNGISVLFAVLTGVLFWTGLVFGIVSILLVNKHRKKSEKKKSVDYISRIRRTGAASFFSNKLAAKVDIAMVALFILMLVTMFIPAVSQNITLVFVAFFMFSVYMHCMLNGVNYKYINSKNEVCKK